MTIRVAVVGAAGRMGATVCRAVLDANDLELVAAIDTSADGQPLSFVGDFPDGSPTISGELVAAVQARADVLVDFTVAEAAAKTLRFGAANGIHVVCGTTGIETSGFVAEFAPPDRPNAIICPNFAISAVLMARLAEIAAPYFDNAEIVELHHDQKRDAPSGTALESARRIAQARQLSGAGDFGKDPTDREVLPGARGARAEANVFVHSIRLKGLVAHQEVIFGTLGQSLTIRQDSYDRTSFMPGVLLAIRKIALTPGLTIGLDRLLEA
ncbi:MAG TPA: 4-hydroxy-tetrahydrodipicolinate reductase [Acidimicrobiales bacterium]|nr:4-hydroxy-tetrahydrodipicolinate reductase [Acidimicrobiales bacterium]